MADNKMLKMPALIDNVTPDYPLSWLSDGRLILASVPYCYTTCGNTKFYLLDPYSAKLTKLDVSLALSKARNNNIMAVFEK